MFYSDMNKNALKYFLLSPQDFFSYFHYDKMILRQICKPKEVQVQVKMKIPNTFSIINL